MKASHSQNERSKAELRFDERVAVITGAGRGLGRAYARLLAVKGARVVVNDPGSSILGRGGDSRPALEVVEEIQAAGGTAFACTESVATPAGGKAIIEAALDHYGRIDILIHNAGNVRRASLKEMTSEDFDAVADVHLHGAFHVVQPAFRIMCKARYGRIVLTSSIGGIYGNKLVANYCASKAGLIGLCNAVALEGADEGVKCNVIIPAAVTRLSEGVDTSTFPSMPPELVAPVVGWLVHESCSVTGEMLISAAGRVAKAFVAETRGVYRPSWTIEQVAEELPAIRDPSDPWVLPPVPSGFMEHLGRSFEVARRGGKA
jgi:NAD(P)-dependent dehydrogenase (short-subunit alcohol dehydrogenase family)